MNSPMPITFQYSVLRYMHDLVTGEFLNVGLVLYAENARTFYGRLLTNYGRASKTFPGMDGEQYRKYALALQRKIDQLALSLNNDQLQLPDRPHTTTKAVLDKILVPDDSALRFGEIESGEAIDLDEAFAYLYKRLVEQYIAEPTRSSRNDDQVWQVYKQSLQARNIVAHLTQKKFVTKYETFEFDHAAKNGAWHVLQPVSLDLVNAGSIRTKARQWHSAVIQLSADPELAKIYILLGKPNQERRDVWKAYSDARRLLVDASQQLRVKVIDESDAESFAADLSPLLEGH